MESTKTAKRVTFETNLQDIVKALEDYKIQHQFENTLYPTSLEQLQNSNTFNKEPVNPYTGKSMLSSNSEESGLQYQAMGGKYKLCVVQRDIEDVNDNGIVDEVLPLSTKTACIGNTQTSVGVTFARNSVAYTSNGAQVAANQPRFEQGKPDFGKAIMIEEGTTNYLPANIQTWGNRTKDATTYSMTPVSTPYGSGIKLTGTSAGRVGKVTNTGGINLGTSYAVASVYFKPVIASGSLAIYWDAKDNTGKWQHGTFYEQKINLSNYTPGQWYRLVCTANISPNTFAPGSGFYIWAEGTFDIIIVAPQLEAKPYATSFIDATRSPETLTIPTAGVLNPQEGTIECWVYVNDLIKNTSAGRYILAHATSDTANFIILRHDVDNMWSALTSNGAGQKSYVRINDTLPIGWHHFAMRWSASELALFIDGVKVDSVNNPYLPSAMNTNFSIGKWLFSAYGWVNTYIDDLALYNRALSDNEVQAIYNSGQSLPVDAWTTLKLDFNGDLSTQSGVIP